MRKQLRIHAARLVVLFGLALSIVSQSYGQTPLAYICTARPSAAFPTGHDLEFRIISDGTSFGIPALLDSETGSTKHLLHLTNYQMGKFVYCLNSTIQNCELDLLIFSAGDSGNPFKAVAFNYLGNVVHYIDIKTYEKTENGFPLIISDLSEARHGFCE